MGSVDVGRLNHSSVASRSRYRPLLPCRSIQFTRDAKKSEDFVKGVGNTRSDQGSDATPENLCRSLRYVSEVGKVRVSKDIYSNEWGLPLWSLVEETNNESPHCGEEKGIRSER
jgi:hypothetical protein